MAFVVRHISAEEYKSLHIEAWENWENTTHRALWEVEETETFYVLEGEVYITVDDILYHAQKNMVVSLPKGLVCMWDIPAFLKKVFILNFELD